MTIIGYFIIVNKSGWLYFSELMKGLITIEKLKLKVTIDRPIGYIDDYNNCYPLNYGYISGIIGGDGEAQDAYIISKNAMMPLNTFEGELIAIITRNDDIETKWVVSDVGASYSVNEIADKVNFLEKYFDSSIELIQ
ncbi:inorganic diphosphatase [Vagococcus silagei]